MEIIKNFAGYNLCGADLLFRAIEEKDLELIQKFKNDFLERATKIGITRDIAKKYFL